jgi:hypothetical protein
MSLGIINVAISRKLGRAEFLARWEENDDEIQVFEVKRWKYSQDSHFEICGDGMVKKVRGCMHGCGVGAQKL